MSTRGRRDLKCRKSLFFSPLAILNFSPVAHNTLYFTCFSAQTLHSSLHCAKTDDHVLHRPRAVATGYHARMRQRRDRSSPQRGAGFAGNGVGGSGGAAGRVGHTSRPTWVEARRGSWARWVVALPWTCLRIGIATDGLPVGTKIALAASQTGLAIGRDGHHSAFLKLNPQPELQLG